MVRTSHRSYTPNVAGVRSTGECFWDTMRYYGIDNHHLLQAARDRGLHVDRYVNADQIWPFLQQLSSYTGVTYQLNIDYIDLFSLTYIRTERHGRGEQIINIGFFYDTNPDSHQGHYVPSGE